MKSRDHWLGVCVFVRTSNFANIILTANWKWMSVSVNENGSDKKSSRKKRGGDWQLLNWLKTEAPGRGEKSKPHE